MTSAIKINTSKQKKTVDLQLEATKKRTASFSTTLTKYEKITYLSINRRLDGQSGSQTDGHTDYHNGASN